MHQGALLLDFRGNVIEAELQLPADRVQTALGVQVFPLLGQDGRARVGAYILDNVSASLPDGRRFEMLVLDPPHVVRIEDALYVAERLQLVPPAGAGTELFKLHCGVLLDRIPSQVILASIRSDWRTSTFAVDPQLVAVLSGPEQTMLIDRRGGSWLNGFGSVFTLGIRHIAEGTDHLLFLLTLLLPAPLVVRQKRWAGGATVRRCLTKIAGIVTAFTLGHSVTLAFGALGLVQIPSRPIETLIAVSILVTAVHALRPVFPGKEAAIAAFFGLIHGLAFSTTLAELGFRRWERVTSIFAFNLGIETMQLIVVAAALPSLILLSRTRLHPALRSSGAVFAAAAATAWIAQRLFDAPNPADGLIAALAHRAVWIALGLTLLGITARSTRSLRSASPPNQEIW
jgi:hypothetical protein